jgi:hypothetical protein
MLILLLVVRIACCLCSWFVFCLCYSISLIVRFEELASWSLRLAPFVLIVA